MTYQKTILFVDFISFNMLIFIKNYLYIGGYPMNILINNQLFQSFIDENKLFEKTFELMLSYLKTWQEDNAKQFIEELWVDFDTVVKTYHFEHHKISISKNYLYDPPLDYISCHIRIYNVEDIYCGEYMAYFDCNLDCFDDNFTR